MLHQLHLTLLAERVVVVVVVSERIAFCVLFGGGPLEAYALT